MDDPVKERQPSVSAEQDQKKRTPTGEPVEETPIPASLSTTNKILEDEDTADLSPPPSESMSPPSSVNLNALEDEIVVGARTANGAADKSSPLQVVSDREDENMADVEDDMEQPVSHYPKRKRTSTYHDLSEDKIDGSVVEETEPTRPIKMVKKPGSGVKGVVLGYWRDSKVPDPAGRHAVIGFIDVRDRLRTRIQTTTRSGDQISQEFPLPPGPGGSWVTFERIVFDDLLVGMDQHQVKEYVKLRADAVEATEEEKVAAQQAAREKAIEHVRNNPPPDTAPPAALAFGEQIPEDRLSARQDAANKRRRISGGFASINSAAPMVAAPEHVALAPAPSQGNLDPLHGTRPTRILIGFWKGSSEPNPKDRHAVYGILGQNDMFRVKVVRETRDGRFVDGNFPAGAGALWIHYDEVEMEPHLKNLNRNEVKEYCRVRQRQIDEKEAPEDRLANETKAVYEAQTRVAHGFRGGSMAAMPRHSTGPMDMEHAPADFGGHELRQSRRIEANIEPAPQPDMPPRQGTRISLNEEGGQLHSPNLNQPPLVAPRPTRRDSDMVERTTHIARREIARAEQAQLRTEKHAANKEAAAAAAASAANTQMPLPPPPPNKNGTRIRFHETDEMQRLNNVWARQEAQRLKAGAEDAKMYGGVKYERKQSGPFQGRFVSQGTIISIDGEDYVEYRVLTKPSFF